MLSCNHHTISKFLEARSKIGHNSTSKDDVALSRIRMSSITRSTSLIINPHSLLWVAPRTYLVTMRAVHRLLRLRRRYATNIEQESVHTVSVEINQSKEPCVGSIAVSDIFILAHTERLVAIKGIIANIITQSCSTFL